MTLGIGAHLNVPERLYHADPAIGVSASATVLRELYSRSPRHAWFLHPKLNPDWEQPKSTEAQETGVILHSIVLGTPSPYVEIPFDDWRTDRAQELRAYVYAEGKIPVLSHRADELEVAAEQILLQIGNEQPEIYDALRDKETTREVTHIWMEKGTLCRCRFDALPPAAYRFALDLKFTSKSAEPEKWSRTLRDDYLFQSALYPRSVVALRGDNPEMRYVAIESEPPFGLTVHSLSEELAMIAKRRLNAALRDWKDCLRHGRWPSYPRLVHYAAAPGWFLQQDDDRAYQQSIAASWGVLGADDGD